ncbi:CPBP family glutamic-type intramembrane protease [Solitalea sp. MAHUQ-68]|uniref:CPBP family glutamic-type intramembrane protease n=1 Tax=Solitalea agri TaxID=2953739 RepID=A0A9X2JDM2_9SPHI|nr:CPBP family intramembrane glutamic endopeptidase [Solitalea agri]MCO4293784.1 CPBP family glutamic-type intramembrane protease [Solitalea agri]
MEEQGITEEEVQIKPCSQCEVAIPVSSKFCGTCGALQTEGYSIDEEERLRGVKQVGFFYTIEFIICLVVKFSELFRDLFSLILIDSFMAIVSIVFYAQNWIDNKQLLRFTNFSVLKVFKYIGLTICFSLLVNISMSWINRSLFDGDNYYSLFFDNYKYSKILMFFFVALTPALFEELAYRGFVLQGLLNVMDKWQAIFLTSFLFALIHLSPISMVWLLPFALWLGYIRTKENTLWYGIIIHFFFNATACTYELLTL